MILPFMINTQHLYAYYNYDEYLTKGFISTKYIEEDKNIETPGNAPFTQSINRHTPLSISIHQNFQECCKVCLKALRKR